MPIDLSIIILCYNSKGFLEALLPSIFSSETAYRYEVIVVDNDSSDGAAEWVKNLIQTRGQQQPRVELIRNQNNGFAAGNNLGIKKARGRYILLLNPDTKLERDTLELMLNFMNAHPAVGVSGCKLVKPDGSLDLASRRRFPDPWISFKRLFLKNNTDYNYSDIDADTEMEVDSVVGAFMLISRQAFQKVGLLDESFFMYGEDLDYCWRCKQAGLQVWYCPKAKAFHYKGESSKKVALRALKWFHDAMWIFYQKHYRRKYFFALGILVWLGIYGRFLGLVAINLFKRRRYVSK